MGDDPFFIVCCGLPLVGKSTIAGRISEELGVRWLDIDVTFRRSVFGEPPDEPYATPELRERERAEMLACYRLLLAAADAFLVMKRSVIITATFSRESYQRDLAHVVATHPAARLRLIWCSHRNDSPEEIERRLEARRRSGYAGGCRSLDHYLADRARYVIPVLPHLALDVFTRPVEECVAAALRCIRSA